MEFTKILKRKYAASDGTCLIRNGQILIKIKTDRPTLKIKNIGIVEGGIGVELTEGNNPLKHCVANRPFSEDDLPVNPDLTGESTYSYLLMNITIDKIRNLLKEKGLQEAGDVA